MAQIHPIDGHCPVCGGGMVITRMSCEACGSSLEGAFALEQQKGAVGGDTARSTPRLDERYGRLSRLDPSQLAFVETFVRCRGVIKNVEDMLGISYPTVKARLSSVLDTMGIADDDDQPAEWRRVRRDILAELAAGRISTDDAHRLLAQYHTPPSDGEPHDA